MPKCCYQWAAVCLLGMMLGAGATLGQTYAPLSEPIYSRAMGERNLLNGWQSWSYDTTFTYGDQTHVRAGFPALSVTITKTGGAFYLHRQAFDARLYSALTFWVNGGSMGGQRLQVQALLSGAKQSPVLLPLLPADHWTQITLPLSSLGVADKTNLDGFWVMRLDGPEKQPKTFYLSEVSLTEARPPASVMIHVASTSEASVDDRMFGLNTASWDARLTSPDTAGTLNALGARSLRFPGGSTADDFHWNTEASRSAFDTFARLVNGLHASGMVTVNYGTGTAREAADWVRYANLTHHDGIRYWEIGNEIWGGWETDHHTPAHNADTYGRVAADYIKQMRFADPTVKVGVALFYGDGPNQDGVDQHWNERVLAQLNAAHAMPDFVTQHNYAQGDGLECDLTLLTDSHFAAEAQQLRDQLHAAFANDSDRIEMLLTECNSVPRKPGKQTASLTNGLFLADTLGQLLGSGYKGFYWWALRNGVSRTAPKGPPVGSNDDSLFGWRPYGDFGLLDDDGRDFDLEGGPTRYPTYYVMELLSHFARGGDRVLQVTTGNSLLSAYGVIRADESVRLLVVNKSLTADISGQLESPRAPLIASVPVEVYQYGLAQEGATPGQAKTVGVVQSRLSPNRRSSVYYFPKYSVTVLVIPHWSGRL